MPVSDQGVTSDRYLLIPRTLIFLTRDQQVLLLLGAPHKRLWSNRYNGVGGHVEPGEDILGSAQRELAEETGLQAGCLWLCGILVVDTGNTPGIAVFVLRGEEPQGQLTSSPEGTLEWVDFTAVPRLPLVEDLYALLPRVLSARQGEAPFSARSYYNEKGKLVLTFSN